MDHDASGYMRDRFSGAFRYPSDARTTRRYHVPYRVAAYLRSLCWGAGSRTVLHAGADGSNACLPNPRAPGLASAGLCAGGTAMAISRAWGQDCADGTMPSGASMTPGYNDIVDCISYARITGGSETLVVFPTRAWAVSVPMGAIRDPRTTQALLMRVAAALTSFVGTDRGFEYADRWCGELERCGFSLRLLQSDQPWDVRMVR